MASTGSATEPESELVELSTGSATEATEPESELVELQPPGRNVSLRQVCVASTVPTNPRPMSEPETVEFVLDGTVAGERLSASAGVPFTRFLEFNEDVQKYVQGSDEKTALRDVKVQIQDGSYLLRVLIPAGMLTSLLSDTARVAQAQSLADIDPVRAKVVARWQERAKGEPSLLYTVRSPKGAFAPLVISKETSLRREPPVAWIEVERYLVGEIMDWGGQQSPNIHLRPLDTRDILIVDAKPDQIRDQRENLVYHKAIVRVSAKQNPKTGALKDYRLIELRAYQPEVDETRLQALFERGAKAWADVPEGSAWVEEQRGGDHA